MLNLHLCPSLTPVYALAVLQPPVSSLSWGLHYTFVARAGLAHGLPWDHILSLHVWGHLCAAGGGQEPDLLAVND